MLRERLMGPELTPYPPWRIDRMVQLALPPSPESPGLARHAVADACATWQIPDHIVDAATLAISELVTNCVQHAKTPILLLVEFDDHNLTIAVGDGESTLPELHPPVIDNERGRGMAVIDALGATWGIQRSVVGKTVWITFVA